MTTTHNPTAPHPDSVVRVSLQAPRATQAAPRVCYVVEFYRRANGLTDRGEFWPENYDGALRIAGANLRDVMFAARVECEARALVSPGFAIRWQFQFGLAAEARLPGGTVADVNAPAAPNPTRLEWKRRAARDGRGAHLRGELPSWRGFASVERVPGRAKAWQASATYRETQEMAGGFESERAAREWCESMLAELSARWFRSMEADDFARLRSEASQSGEDAGIAAAPLPSEQRIAARVEREERARRAMLAELGVVPSAWRVVWIHEWRAAFDSALRSELQRLIAERAARPFGEESR